MSDPTRATSDLERLGAVSAALSLARTERAVVEAVLTSGVASLDATTGVVGLLTADRRHLKLVDFAGERDASYEHTEIPADAPVPIAYAVASGQIEHVASRAELEERYPAVAVSPFSSSHLGALVCAPLVVDGEAIGAIGFAFHDERAFDDRERRFLGVLAQQCAIALERARLYDVEVAAKAAELLRDEYLARVSHELRTPLAAMRMWIQVLRSGRLEDRRAAIDAIDKSAVSQSKLIEDLLDFARGVNGKLRITEQIHDARVPIEDAVGVMRPEAEAKSILLLTAIASDAGHVCGDPGRLQQVVVNLLSNAIKFTPRGGRIEVLLRAEEDTVVLSVSDSGPGIEASALEAVFAPFHQREPAGEAHGGLGLGLTIARHLVELHGGTISAESRGDGATFLVRLPRIPDDEVPPTPSQSAREAEPSAVLLAGLRVLVVDDHAACRDALARMLEGVGAHVIAVATAREAAANLEQSPIAVLVSDIGMPDEDGCSLLRRLRAIGVLTPAIALTAHARPEDASRTLAAGFQLHMVKPVESRELIDNVARLAGRAPPTPPGRSERRRAQHGMRR